MHENEVMITSLGAGYALVPVEEEWNPNEGGGPIRKATGSNPVYAQAGNTVYRTPHLVTREAEAGANWPGDLTKMMFLPDGRIVPAEPYAFDMFRGAGAEVVCGGGSATSALRTLIPAAAMFAGAGMGFKLTSQHRGWGVLGGAITGGILGLIFR